MYQIVEDHSQDTLISMADEVLAIIRGEGNDEEKKLNMEAIFGERVSHEHFFDLSNIAKTITDYEVQKNEEMAEEDIAIIEEDEEEEDSDGNIVSDVESVEEDRVEGNKIERREKMKRQEENQNELNPTNIDAHWLHSQLNNYYDPT